MNTVEPIRDFDLIQDIADYLKDNRERDYVLFMTGIYIGRRISDILPLKVRDVKDKDHIYIREKKTNKEAKVLINDELKEKVESKSGSLGVYYDLIFSNSKTGKKDYASKMLNYPLEQGEANSYDKLMSVLFSPAERHKIEWAIGSVVSGDSKRQQKFMVLYGAAGTGKSTVLNIIQQLFDGYYSVFDAKALGSSN